MYLSTSKDWETKWQRILRMFLQLIIVLTNHIQVKVNWNKNLLRKSLTFSVVNFFWSNWLNHISFLKFTFSIYWHNSVLYMVIPLCNSILMRQKTTYLYTYNFFFSNFQSFWWKDWKVYFCQNGWKKTSPQIPQCIAHWSK